MNLIKPASPHWNGNYSIYIYSFSLHTCINEYSYVMNKYFPCSTSCSRTCQYSRVVFKSSIHKIHTYIIHIDNLYTYIHTHIYMYMHIFCNSVTSTHTPNYTEALLPIHNHPRQHQCCCVKTGCKHTHRGLLYLE